MIKINVKDPNGNAIPKYGVRFRVYVKGRTAELFQGLLFSTFPDLYLSVCTLVESEFAQSPICRLIDTIYMKNVSVTFSYLVSRLHSEFFFFFINYKLCIFYFFGCSRGLKYYVYCSI